MAETVLVTQTVNDVKVTQDVNKVVISSPGPQGPSGRTILNGQGAPANNLGPNIVLNATPPEIAANTPVNKTTKTL